MRPIPRTRTNFDSLENGVMRLTAYVGLAAMSLLPMRTGQAQEIPTTDFAERGPRFLMSGTPEATRLDVARTSVLRRRIALDLENVSMHDALTTISRESGLQLMF